MTIDQSLKTRKTKKFGWNCYYGSLELTNCQNLITQSLLKHLKVISKFAAFFGKHFKTHSVTEPFLEVNFNEALREGLNE